MRLTTRNFNGYSLIFRWKHHRNLFTENGLFYVTQRTFLEVYLNTFITQRTYSTIYNVSNYNKKHNHQKYQEGVNVHIN